MRLGSHILRIDQVTGQLITDCRLAAANGTGDGSNAVAFVVEHLDFVALIFTEMGVVFSSSHNTDIRTDNHERVP